MASDTAARWSVVASDRQACATHLPIVSPMAAPGFKAVSYNCLQPALAVTPVALFNSVFGDLYLVISREVEFNWKVDTSAVGVLSAFFFMPRRLRFGCNPIAADEPQCFAGKLRKLQFGFDLTAC